jgi:hypothetical protein
VSLRAQLSLGLCVTLAVLGLWTCLVQSRNHERAESLSRIQRQWEMVNAANAQARAVVSSHVPGVANSDLSAGAQRRTASPERSAP